MDKTIIAFIPARSGSQRILHKNVKDFFGHPLMAYAIEGAKQAGIFKRIIVSSNSLEYRITAHGYGAESLWRIFSANEPLSPDVEWITTAIRDIEYGGNKYDYYAILRPTNPFRQPETIVRAWKQLLDYGTEFDSLKAYTRCYVNPNKIWEILKYDNTRDYMIPIREDIPQAYNFPLQAFDLKHTYGDQVGFLDICKWDNIKEYKNQFGRLISPFYVDSNEAFDINTPDDWEYAEFMKKKGKVKLVEI